MPIKKHFDPAKHPRGEKGTRFGGKFVQKIPGSQLDKEQQPPAKPKVIKVAASNGTRYELREDMSFSNSTILPNGKKAKQYLVTNENSVVIGTIEEVNGYKDIKPAGSRIVMDRKVVVQFLATTFNEKFPIYQRTTFSLSRPYVVDWLDARAAK